MLLSLLLAATAVPTLADVRHGECREAAMKDAATGAAEARAWIAERDGWRAEQCLGLALSQAFDWAPAAAAFERAASLAGAEKARDEAGLWVAAGNAMLASGDAARALVLTERGIALGTLAGRELGEAVLDRARMLVVAGRTDDARQAFGQVQRLVPDDPLGWLLSATLARRQGDLKRADADIAVAARLAPTDPAIALELGNIAASKGDVATAKAQWQQAIAIDAGSLPAQAAQRQIAALGR